MRRQSLLVQVLTVNAVMICVVTLFVDSVARADRAGGPLLFLAIAAAVVLSVALNLVVLRRRFIPLETLIDEMERVDLSRPGANLPVSFDGKGETEEVERIELAFIRMMRRLEAERRSASGAALHAQEEERARVARDLHDEVNQSLTGVLLRLEAAREAAPPELRAEIAETRVLANKAMEELLALARQLRPTALDDLGLKAAVAGLVEQVDRSTDMRATFRADGGLTGLDGDVQIVLYRVAQEALSNVVRHSAAKTVTVSLSRHGNVVELTVTDDGVGFAFARSEDGLGLGGMRERALLVEGDLEIRSGPGRGTTVALRVPDPGQFPAGSEAQ